MNKKFDLIDFGVSLVIGAAVGVLLATLCTGCTYSITMVHTQGTASDVVDETTTPSTSVTATIPAIG